jgi:hypothetical protein
MLDQAQFQLPPPLHPLTGQESLTLNGESLANSQVLDFWRWAFSDLRMNNVRGVLAEYIVAKLLNIPLETRDSWESYDLKTAAGITIEVKAAAYLQAWEQRQPSRIVFTGLQTRTWSPRMGYGEQGYGADVYALCLLTEQDPARFDPLNLDQWQFWLLSRAVIIQLTHNGHSLSLSTLYKAGIVSYTATELASQGLALLDTSPASPGVESTT